MGDLRALRQLTLTRVRVMLREPEIIFWVFLFPVLLAIGIGIAFSDPAPEQIRVAVEADSPALSYLEALEELEEVEVRILSPPEAAEALRRGEVALVVGNGDQGVTFRYDPTRPEGRTARLLADRTIQEAAGAGRPVAIRHEEVDQRGHRYIDWLIPGIIGFNLMSTGMWGVGFYVTRSRQNLQLKRLVATPMPRGYFLLSQILARFFFLMVEVPLVIFFAWLVFGVPMVGNPVALTAVVLLGAACFSGFGLLASSRVRTTEGVSGIINVIIMPMVVLCGVFFSPARFPDAMQPLIQILPLTALNDALRAVYNDGLPLAATAGDLALLAGWTALTFILALRWFRWQ
jgi:ABC-2 type transport system permease protein